MPHNTNRFLRTTTVAVVILTGAGLAGAQTQSATRADAYDATGWKTIIYPVYGWAPIFGADVRLPEQPTPPDVGGGGGGGGGGIGGGGGGGGGVTIPSAKTSNNFNGAAFGGFRVERSRVAVESTFLWAGMSGSVETPRFRLHVNTLTYKVLGGFEVLPALYIEGGARYLGIKMTASILSFPEVTWKPGIWEPVVGATFHPQLTRTFRLVAQADYGGIGDDSHRASAAKATFEWKPISHLLLSGGWGVLYVRADGTILDKPVHLRQTLNGPVVAFGIAW